MPFEPDLALVGGDHDGLGDIRTIIRQASDYLTPGGWLLLEHGYDQYEQVAQLLTDHDYAEIGSAQDLHGQPRCSFAKLN